MNAASWLPTAGRRTFDLLSPDPDDVDFVAMSEQLSKLPRWVGATPGTVISVGEHSINVCRIVSRRAQPYALLHDGREYAVGDHTRPFQVAMEHEQPGFRAARDRILGRIDAAIHVRAGLAWPPAPEIKAEVKAADDIMLVTEHRHLFPPGSRALPVRAAPVGIAIRPAPTWHTVHEAFLAELRRLLPHVLP